MQDGKNFEVVSHDEGQTNLHTLALHQMFMLGRWPGRVQGTSGSLQVIPYGMLVKWMNEHKSQSLDLKQYIVYTFQCEKE